MHTLQTEITGKSYAIFRNLYSWIHVQLFIHPHKH